VLDVVQLILWASRVFAICGCTLIGCRQQRQNALCWLGVVWM